MGPRDRRPARPRAKDKTVEAAFAEERARLVELPGDDFPVEERVVVTSGKTPYVRFDRNDYSVPHTHVCRSLTVLASDERVRVVDPEAPTAVLADHKRSFDRSAHRARGHVRWSRRSVRRTRAAADRLFSAAPSTLDDAEARRAQHQPRPQPLGSCSCSIASAPKCLSAVAGIVARDQLQLQLRPSRSTAVRDEAGLARTRRCARTHLDLRPAPRTTERPMASTDKLPETLKRLRLFGLLAASRRSEQALARKWSPSSSRKTAGVAHRQHLAGISVFKPVSSFDWKWSRKIDRPLIEELFTLGFIAEGERRASFSSANGVGKTMLLHNLADRALNAGQHVRAHGNDLLADILAESSVARARGSRPVRCRPFPASHHPPPTREAGSRPHNAGLSRAFRRTDTTIRR